MESDETALVRFVKRGDVIANYRIKNSASLPRVGDTVHLGDEYNQVKVVNVVWDYSWYDSGDMIDGAEEISIDVVDY